MTQANDTVTTIRPIAAPLNQPPNPIQAAVENCGRRMLAMQTPRLWGEGDKGAAQELTRSLLDFAQIVDETLLAIGREARAHFGSGVELAYFTDQLRDALEGFGTHSICAAAEAREEELADELGDGDTRYKLARDYAA